jgi:hypothetical protein
MRRAILICLILAYNASPSFGQNTASEKLWRAYADQIATFISGASKESVAGLQLLSVAAVADWENDKFADYNRNVKWCDSVPKYGPMFEPSAKSVSSGYRVYLESLKLPPTDKKKVQEIEAARKEWIASTARVNEIRRRLGAAWTTFQRDESQLPPNRRYSYDRWYEQHYGKLVGDARRAESGKAQVYAKLLVDTYQGFNGVADAIIDYGNDSYQLESPSPDGLQLAYRTCNASPSLTDVVQRGRQQATANAFAQKITLSTSHKQRTESEWTVSAGAAGFLGFIGFGGGGSYTHREVHEKTRKFLLDVQFRNLELVNFTRTKWFNGTVVGLLNKKDDFAPGAAGNPERLWGQNGLLPLLPVQAVVAYQPTVTVTFDDEDYDFVFSKWDAGAAILAGPFVIVGKGSGSSQETVWNRDTKTMTSTFKTDTPYVIAVKNVIMPGL